MIPKRVLLENFLSFGSPATEIVFGDDEPLWVLSGPNGVGKSAVFDAITYALFGCHRGGGQNADQLVRHGANGFRVVFDFEFNGTDYRITRSRTARTTQKVERRHSNTGSWEPVANVNSAGDVKVWAEQTLGLGFDAFTVSVLLRQGEADAIITAGGTDRLKILKKIIGVERYEALSERVHAASRKCKDRFEALRDRRDGLKPVGGAEVEASQEGFRQAEAARTVAHQVAAEAAGRVKEATQWVKLDADRRKLEGQIHEADARAANAERLRADMARLEDLAVAVPVLWDVLTLRSRLDATDRQLAGLRIRAERLTTDRDGFAAAAEQVRREVEAHGAAAEQHARQAQRQFEEVERETRFVTSAEQAAALRVALNAFPLALDAELAAMLERVRSAGEVVTRLGETRAEAAGLLRQFRKQQQEFADVAVGVTCSRCGQLVTAEHAERERSRLAGEVQAQEECVRDAVALEKSTAEDREVAQAELRRLNEQMQCRTITATRLSEQERVLSDLGLTADVKELRRQLDLKRATAAHHKQEGEAEAIRRDAVFAEAQRLDGERQGCETQLGRSSKEIREAEQRVATDRGQLSTQRARLSTDWQMRLDGLDPQAVEALDAERQRLTRSEVIEQCRRLEQDAAVREEWSRQLATTTQGMDEVPVGARVPVIDAERQAQQFRQAALDADKARDDAKATADELTRRAAEYRELVGQVASAESRADLHRKLDGLLGKGGLQRELVRTAEREIVRLANDTVQNLSDGDLTIELDDGADGSDEAFALRVRRADCPKPIAVSFLSGSQKFRVAISVALAIGRFAAGQARPLESVIIDEGFGSLDRDGLRAAAEELNRLRQHLRRIVLVSHQEEFADKFPVLIRLTAGDSGTTTEAVRR